MEITLRSRLGPSAASGRAQPGAATGGKSRPSRIARRRSAVHVGPRSRLRLGPRPAFFLGREDLIRVYPPQEFPVTGREAAAIALAGAPKAITFGEPKGEVSHGGDLGFAWGEYTAATPGDYLRIWRKNRAGNWKLALELLHPR